MNNDKINYFFNYKEHFFTIQKDYGLRLQKSGRNIYINREEKISSIGKKDTTIDHGERFSGLMNAGGVYNQLANVRQIVFEVTDACNLQCTYCSYGKFYGDYDKRENQYIDIHKSKILIDYVVERLHSAANKSSRRDVTISFYGGEPLLNMNFIHDIVEYTHSKTDDRVGFKYNMTTNGVSLKKELDFLVCHDFKIMVSLDGSETNDEHRKFHNGKSSFPVVYENLIYTRKKYPDFFEKNISFNAVLHNLNNESEAFHFFQKEFDKIPMFSDINDIGVKYDMHEAFDSLTKQKEKKPDKELDTLMNKVLDLNSGENRNLQHFIFHYSGNVYRTYNDLLRRTDEIRYIPTATCYPFSKKIFMTVNGKILPCERIGHQFSMGKVTESGVEIDCEAVANKCNGYYDSLRKQCNNCFQAGHCIQCMYIIKNLENKPVCQGFSNRQRFENYLQEKLNHLSQRPELYKRIIEEIVVID